MKKFLTLLVTFVLTVTMLFAFGCGKNPDNNDKNPEQNNPVSYSFYAPDGAPALSIAKLVKDKENFGVNGSVDYNIISASDIGPVVAKNKADLLIMPINAASKLYNKNADDPYKMVSVITHGNLFITSSDGTDTLDKLVGKVVGVIGTGLVPELTFKAVLKANNMLDKVVDGESTVADKIVFRHFEDATKLMPLLKKGDLKVGLLAEPAVTKLETKLANNQTWTRMNIQELYDAEAKSFPQAVLMVKSSVLKAQPQLISAIENKFNENSKWINSNVTDAVTAINSALKEGMTPSLDASVINNAVISNCNFSWQGVDSAKTVVKTYINKLIDLDAKSAIAISDDFFA